MGNRIQEVLEPVGIGEQVLFTLPGDILDEWYSIDLLCQEAASYSAKLHRLSDRLKARRLLLWAKIKDEHPEADAADAKGMVLAFRLDRDGIPVVVSFKAEEEHEESGSPIKQLIEFLHNKAEGGL